MAPHGAVRCYRVYAGGLTRAIPMPLGHGALEIGERREWAAARGEALRSRWVRAE